MNHDGSKLLANGSAKVNVDKLINVASSIHRDVIALINLKRVAQCAKE